MPSPLPRTGLATPCRRPRPAFRSWYGFAAAGLLAIAPAAAGGQVEARPLAVADRSHEILDYRCESELGRRQVTLFANGTVRLWDGLTDDLRMTLGELDPDELDGYVRRLRGEDLSEVDESRDSPEGSWIERCMVTLALGDGTAASGRVRRYTFGRYDSLPLALSAVVRVADELATRTLPLDQLPVGYEPKAGDVLRRHDGALFEIVGVTGDGLGLELSGRDQPLTLYLRPEDLRGQFEALVSRREP